MEGNSVLCFVAHPALPPTVVSVPPDRRQQQTNSRAGSFWPIPENSARQLRSYFGGSDPQG